MGQHFLLSARARTLSIGKVSRMTDSQVEGMFSAIRWADTDGTAPHDITSTRPPRRHPGPSGSGRTWISLGRPMASP